MVNIKLTNPTKISGAGKEFDLPVGMETLSIDNLLLTAGFPFVDFTLPEVTFTAVKNNIIQNQFDEGCDTRITAGSIKYSYFKVHFNIPSREDYKIEGVCSYEFSGKNSEITKTGSYNLYDVFKYKFGINVDNAIDLIWTNQEVKKVTPAGYWTSGRIAHLQPFTDLLLSELFIKVKENDDDDYYNSITLERVRGVSKVLQWLGFGFSPYISTIESGQVAVKANIGFTSWNSSSDYIALDTNLITSWSEERSKIGFEVIDEGLFKETLNDNETGWFREYERENGNFGIDAIGEGLTHRLDMSQLEGIKIKRKNGSNFPLTAVIGDSAILLMLYFDKKLTDKVLTIETWETTPVVPYSKVILEGKTYICIEAEIPFPTFEKFKYKLKEVK